MTPTQQLQLAHHWLAQSRQAYVVEVTQTRGSTPREAGARMLVSANDVVGTIGGGHLEWQAVSLARHALTECRQHERPPAWWSHDLALGPSLGQCCGGTLRLTFYPLGATVLDAWRAAQPQPRFHLELHGAGHVGQAIVRILCGIDCTVRWIDERDPTMPLANGAVSAIGLPSPEQLAALPPHIAWCPTDQADAEVMDAPAHACHLVLTHRHDLDLRLVHAILKRSDAAFVGMIGSKTKHAQFRRRLAEQGLPDEAISRLCCPIGLAGIEGKEPAVIAVSVAAQLLSLASVRAP